MSMKTVKVGNVEVLADLVVTKKELKKRYSAHLNDAQLEELYSKLKKNDVRRAKSSNKSVRIKKSDCI